MATNNPALMKMARERLKGNWGLAIGTFLVYTLLTGAAGAFDYAFSIITLLIGGPLSLGAAVFSLSIARNKEARLEQLFDGFYHFVNALVA